MAVATKNPHRKILITLFFNKGQTTFHVYLGSDEKKLEATSRRNEADRGLERQDGASRTSTCQGESGQSINRDDQEACEEIGRAMRGGIVRRELAWRQSISFRGCR